MGVLARASLVALVAACSGPKDAFECTTSASCRNGGTTGTCESTGFCSFPDPTCPMGSRYGGAAGGGLAGQCVGETGSGSDGGTGSAVDPRPLGTWIIATPTQAPPPRYTHATAVDGNFIYLIGGIEGSTGHSDVWFATADPNAALPSVALAAWTQTSSLPANRWTFAAAYDSGYLYTFAGRTDANTNTPDVLVAPVNADGTLGAWTTTTSLPESIKCEAVASSGDNVYVIGGKASSGATSVVLRATMSSGTVTAWKNAGSLDTTVFNESAVVANGYLYVLGGCASGDNTCSQVLDIVEYAKINADGSLGNFARTTALPMPRWHHTATVSPAGDIYISGGKYGPAFADKAIADVIAGHVEADGTIAAWHAMTPLAMARVRATSAVIGPYLFVLHAETQVAPIN